MDFGRHMKDLEKDRQGKLWSKMATLCAMCFVWRKAVTWRAVDDTTNGTVFEKVEKCWAITVDFDKTVRHRKQGQVLLCQKQKYVQLLPIVGVNFAEDTTCTNISVESVSNETRIETAWNTICWHTNMSRAIQCSELLSKNYRRAVEVRHSPESYCNKWKANLHSIETIPCRTKFCFNSI